MTNFVCWDIESSGLNTTFDQILSFAATLTDSNLNVIDEFSLKGSPSKGVLPHFAALNTILPLNLLFRLLFYPISLDELCS